MTDSADILTDSAVEAVTDSADILTYTAVDMIVVIVDTAADMIVVIVDTAADMIVVIVDTAVIMTDTAAASDTAAGVEDTGMVDGGDPTVVGGITGADTVARGTTGVPMCGGNSSH